MSMHGENQVRNFFVVGTSTNTTMSDVRSGQKLNAAIIEADGTAAVDNGEFALVVKNNRNEISLSDIIEPSRVKSAYSVPFVARVGQNFTVSNIVAEASKLYQLEFILKGYGSLSIEDEYIKKAQYKSKTGDTDEDIIDGLVKSLAKNMGREQPEAQGTFPYVLKGGTTINLKDNLCFEFDKITTDGTAEISTLTVTAVPTEDGVVKVTLNGQDYFFEVTALGATVTTTAVELVAQIDALNDYTATNSAGVITITAVNKRAEANLAFDDNGVADIAATAATTTAGVDGTDFALKISEKHDWLEKYYVTGKKTRLQLDWTIDAYFPTLPTITKVLGNQGQGTGYHVRNMEEYYLGNRGDTFRGAGYPHNFEQTYDSVLTGEYSLIEIEYFEEGRDDPMKSKKHLTIAAPSVTTANALIAQLNTALTTRGITLSTLS